MSRPVYPFGFWPMLVCCGTAMELGAYARAQCGADWIPDFDAHGFDDWGWAAAVFDEDGPGPKPPCLFVGGEFTTAGGIQARGIARWDPVTRRWSEVGGGIRPTENLGALVQTLLVFDEDGPGPMRPSLYVGGIFSAVGDDIPAKCIARWDGLAWSTLGSGIDGFGPEYFTVFDDDGPGPRRPALYVAGWFPNAGGQRCNSIARWDGSGWSALAGGVIYQPFLEGIVDGMVVLDEDGSGPGHEALFVGGRFTKAGSVSANNIARWDGQAWTAVGPASGTDDDVRALAVFDDDGPGPMLPALIAGGFFTTLAGQPVNHFARWNGQIWEPLSGLGANGTVDKLWTVRDPSLPDSPIVLIASGLFDHVGGTNTGSPARFDGVSWMSFGPLEPNLCGGPRAVVEFDEDDSGPAPSRLWMPGAIRQIDWGVGGYCGEPVRFLQNLVIWGAAHLPGDADDSGLVEFADVASTFGAWGADYRPTTGPGDANRDGLVNFDDVLSTLAGWGGACP